MPRFHGHIGPVVWRLTVNRRAIGVVCGYVLVVFISFAISLRLGQLSVDNAEAILGGSLTLGSTLIAVVGILLSIYVTQKLRGTINGQDFGLLIISLTITMALAFCNSIILFAYVQSPSPLVGLIAVFIFSVTLLATIVGLIATVTFVLMKP